MSGIVSNDVSQSEFTENKSNVIPVSQLNNADDADLLTVVINGILSRPLIREQVNEVLASTSKQKGDKVVEVFQYPTSLIVTALSSAIKKVLILDMNKVKTNSMFFPSLNGKICLLKSSTDEKDTGFTKSKEEHIYAGGVFAGNRYKFLDFSLTNGRLCKDTLTTLKGTKLAVMIIESVGITSFKIKLANAGNVTSTLDESCKDFIRDFTTETPRYVSLMISEMEEDKKRDKRELSKEAYMSNIKELAYIIKDELKKSEKLTNTRSKTIIPSICFVLMERFGRKESFD